MVSVLDCRVDVPTSLGYGMKTQELKQSGVPDPLCDFRITASMEQHGNADESLEMPAESESRSNAS